MREHLQVNVQVHSYSYADTFEEFHCFRTLDRLFSELDESGADLTVSLRTCNCFAVDAFFRIKSLRPSYSVIEYSCSTASYHSLSAS